MGKGRKGILGFAGLVAAFLALASVAYACVIFKGDLQIKSPSGNGNKVTGDGAAHGYCPGGGATTAARGASSDTITVKVAPATQCNAVVTNHLGSGSKEIRIRNVNAYVGVDGIQWSMIQGMGCWGGASTLIKSTTLSGGSGTDSFTLGTFSPNITGTASNLCVGSGVLGEGIMAPLVIL